TTPTPPPTLPQTPNPTPTQPRTPTRTPPPTPTPTPTPAPPMIITQPASVTVTAGRVARFTVVATGPAPLKYQWKKNGTDITGATRPAYNTPPTTALDNGSVFAVTVSNRAGSVVSNDAILTIR